MNKRAKEKNAITIYRVLHKILDIIKKLYEIVKVLKAIKELFS